MEWITRLNDAMHYIEKHLADNVDYNEAARCACCSVFHFQRMFSYMAGMPLSEYIRRRRMTLAALDLAGSEIKIIDLALKYGYHSPTAFSRAFQSVHGIAPSDVRGSAAVLTAFPPLRFHITITGGREMNYRIEKKEAFHIVGARRSLLKNIEENFQIVPPMWQELGQSGTLERMIGMMDSDFQAVLGISSCHGEEWNYYIGVPTTQKAFSGTEEYTVPAGTWAVFPGRGEMPGAIQELEKRAVTEWLPSSGYEYDNRPDVEVYFDANPQDASFEIWIPVVKK